MKIHMVEDRIFLDVSPAELSIIMSIFGRMTTSKLKTRMYCKISDFFQDVFTPNKWQTKNGVIYSDAVVVHGDSIELDESKLHDILLSNGVSLDFSLSQEEEP